MKLALGLAAALCLAGCQTITDVTPAGGGTFMVAASGKSGGGAAADERAIALKRANEFCEARHEHLEVIDTHLVDPAFGRSPSAQIDFRCDQPGGSSH